MAWPGTVADNKNLNPGYTPLLLAVVTFQGGATLNLSTHPLDGTRGSAFPGVTGGAPAGSYVGRIAQQDIDTIQSRSPQGIDRVPKITLHIWDGDFTIYNTYAKVYGFRGASLQIWLTLWQAGTSNFATDSPLLFSGTCDMEVPQEGMTVLAVTANTGHNTATIRLPLFPIQNRCPLDFPPDAASRFAALNDPSSPYYPCGYSPDQTGGVGNTGPANHTDSYGNKVTDGSGYYIVCDYLRSDPTKTDTTVGCMARLGNYATTTVAPDGDLMHDTASRLTGHFAGIQWSPGTFYAWDRNYVSNTGIPTFSFANSAIWGQYLNLLYGHQMVNCKIANVVESGNDTKCEALICVGDVGVWGVDLVIANGVQIGEDPTNDKNLWWAFANDGTHYSTGGRTGMAARTYAGALTGYSNNSSSALGDPYGSIARIIVNMYKDIFTGYGTPAVQVRAFGPRLWTYAPISTISGSGSALTITFTSTTPNYYCSGPGSYQVVGTSLTGANGSYTGSAFSSFTQGPPGTLVLTGSTSGSGTGGYVGFLADGTGLSYHVTGASWSSGTATITIGTHSITVGQTVTVGGIFGSAGLPQGLLYNGLKLVTAVSSTTISYLVPINPGTYVSGGQVFTAATNSNPIWVLMDVLLKCNWRVSEINLDTFVNSANFCDQPIKYINSSNQTAAHERYKCAFVLEQRRTAAEVISGILRGFNGYLYYDQAGLLCVGILQTLADSQPTLIPESNYTTPVTSQHYDGTSGNGYIAYSFDDSNIARTGSGDNERLDIEWVDNATILTPNEIVIGFQDEDNQWVQDSLTMFDQTAILRAGGALQPGGSVVQESPSILGITNFDQATRIANTIMAERQYGNENNDPRGTRTCVIGTTVQVEHLRSGHLVWLSLANINLSQQLFRVVGIKPSTDYQGVKITLQWENEIWRTDAYGQSPQAFASNPVTSKAQRIPHVWQPYAEQPDAPSGDTFPQITPTEWTFHLAELDSLDGSGNPLVQIQVGGKFPLNQIDAACQPPRLTGVAFNATGGSIAPGSYLVSICAIDANGLYSAASGIVKVKVPTGTSTNQIVIGAVGWMPQTAGYDVFVGTDQWSMTSQLKAATGGTPSAITLTSLPNVQAYAQPDMLASSLEVQAKSVIHGGIIGEQVVQGGVSGSTVEIGAPPTGTLGNTLTGYHLMLVGRQNNSGNNLPYNIFTIASYTNSGSNPVFTLDRAIGSDLMSNDAIVICAQANLNPSNATGTDGSTNVIGDSNFVNAYNGNTGVSSSDVGSIVRIIAGTGRYQTRTIIGVSDTGGSGGNNTYTVGSPWSVAPDSTSLFIVEEPHWRFGSETTSQAVQVLSDQTLALADVTNLRESTILVQPLIVDGTGTLTSSERRSPLRMLYLFGAGGTRYINVNNVSDGAYPTDGIVVFDTTGVTQPTATTLTSAITDTTGTSIHITSGADAINGTVIMIDTELMYIQAGGNTLTLTVVRGWNGSTAATHLNGATVTLPGAMQWKLLPFAQVPNQRFIFTKALTSTDINYVRIIPNSSSDQLPDDEQIQFGGGTNGSGHIIPDNSSAYGTYGIVVPAAS